MGFVASKLWSRLFGKQEKKIVIVGLDNAGKTTTLYKLLLNEVVQTTPTIGSNVEEVVYKNIHFLMWDIGGQTSIRKSWATYYVNTQAVIMVIDSTDSERIHIARDELHNMLGHESLHESCLLIFANKQDVDGAMSVAAISTALDLPKLSTDSSRSFHIQACCALSGDGLFEGLDWIVQQLS